MSRRIFRIKGSLRLCERGHLIHEFVFDLMASALFASKFYKSLCTMRMLVVLFYLAILRFEGHQFWECCCRPDWKTREREEKSTAQLTSTASIISYDISPKLERNYRLFLFLLDASTDSPTCIDSYLSLHHAIENFIPRLFPFYLTN